MKKTIALISSFALAAAVAVPTVAFAVGSGQSSTVETAVQAPIAAVSTQAQAATSRACGNDVDANADGVCDNAANGQGGNYVDANGDGVCDNRGTGNGAGFVDADADGVCDNEGNGQGYGHGNGGAGFVDANADGVCDNAGSGNGQGKGHGMGNGAGCRR